MTGEKYKIVFLNGLDGLCSIQDTEAEIPTFYNDLGYINHIKPVCDLLNEQEERIKKLESENKMLKTTISRNEVYINQIKTIGKWSNTGDVE